MTKNRVAALCVCALVCIALLFSSAFIALEADHDCIGHSCQICLEIQACKLLLNGMGGAAVAVAVLGGLVRGGVRICAVAGLGLQTVTPVSLKVKLSN